MPWSPSMKVIADLVPGVDESVVERGVAPSAGEVDEIDARDAVVPQSSGNSAVLSRS
jgi:hypothetical protein